MEPSAQHDACCDPQKVDTYSGGYWGRILRQKAGGTLGCCPTAAAAHGENRGQRHLRIADV